MAAGLTRKEQLALLGTVGLILTGLAIRQWHGGRPDRSIYVDGQGRWQKLTEFKAGERPTTPSLSSQPESADSATSPTARGGGIDLNSASLEELDRLPGIGQAKAQAIVQTRQRLGGFRDASQLLDVPGIGPSTLERMRPFIRITPPPGSALTTPTVVTEASTPTLNRSASAARPAKPEATKRSQPVNINTAGIEQLQDIRGIGPALAARIVEDRRRNGPYRRPEDLIKRVRGIGPKNFETIRPQVTVE